VASCALDTRRDRLGIVIPAKAGTQLVPLLLPRRERQGQELGPGLRRGDDWSVWAWTGQLAKMAPLIGAKKSDALTSCVQIQ
jgi:hypothetical protein